MTNRAGNRLAASLCLILPMMPACAAQRHWSVPPVPPPCPAPRTSIEGERRSPLGDFSIVVPPEFRPVPVRGIDSYVGQWRSGQAHIGFDYGRYSDPLLPTEGMLDYQACNAEIGGREARVVTYWAEEERAYRVGAHWVVGGGEPSDRVEGWRSPVYLTVYGSTRSAAEVDRLRKVLWSVRFDAGSEDGAEQNLAGGTG
jgi:hypothetical protein